MTRTADQAIAHCFNQSTNGPQFEAGLCKQRTRIAYGVPSDGADDATEAWRRTDHRIAVTGTKAPRGALVWWTGGSEGHGHVAIADGKGGVWSVDVKRAGYWDHVPFGQIAAWAPALRFAGVSADIDGVQVIPVPAPAPREPFEPLVLTRLRNAWRDGRIVHWTTFDALIRNGAQPEAAAAKVARDKIADAMREFFEAID